MAADCCAVDATPDAVVGFVGAEGEFRLYGVPTLIHLPCEVENSNCAPLGAMNTEFRLKPTGTGVPETCCALEPPADASGAFGCVDVEPCAV